MAVNQKFIDIDNVFSRKNPRLYRIIPGFIINYIKKITHQDELNDAINKNQSKYGVDFALAMIEEFQAKIVVSGDTERLKSGRYIIAGNHPLGGLDGIALICVAGEAGKDIRFIVNDLLLNIDNLKDIFIPVNKHGSNPKAAIKMMDDAYASDQLILTFPAGLCSRKRKNMICDLEWKKSFITKARQHKRDIIPVFIGGNNSNFFYRLANLRKRLGIKANIEMFFLVDEMYKQKGKTINICFGETISADRFTREKSDTQWAEYVKHIVYDMGKQKID